MADLIFPERCYATIPQVALFTGLSTGTIRNLVATGELTGYRPVPGRIIIHLREVEEVIRKSAGRTSKRGGKPRNWDR